MKEYMKIAIIPALCILESLEYDLRQMLKEKDVNGWDIDTFWDVLESIKNYTMKK